MSVKPGIKPMRGTNKMENFEQVLGRLMLAHAELKAVSPKVLSDARKLQRSEQLTALRGAIAKLLKVRYGQLSASAKANAQELETATDALTKALDSARTTVQIIEAISSFLRMAINLIALL